MYAVLRALTRSLTGQPPEETEPKKPEGEESPVECRKVRDVFLKGDCQAIAKSLAVNLGLGKRLNDAFAAGVTKTRVGHKK